MPQLGESIAEATITAHLVGQGESIALDEEIFEVETEKATLSVTSPCSGMLEDIRAEVGQSYAVGAVLGYVHRFDSVETESDANDPPVEDAGLGQEEGVKNNQGDAHEGESVNPEVKPTIRGLPVPAHADQVAYLSPRMKARMHELGLNQADLSGIAGSGGAGRVTIQDFESFLAGLESHERTKASGMRTAVADAMRRSWTRPLATVGILVSVERLLEHRRQQAPKPGVTLYVARALGLALAKDSTPAGRLVGNEIVHPLSIDVGFAVEVEDGVIVPVLRNLNERPFATWVDVYSDLVKKAQQRDLSPAEMEGGIATITNYGTFGLDWATPIPLPEQTLVLGVGSIRIQPVWNDSTGRFEPVRQTQLTLSFDHRVLDGGAAGRFLKQIVAHLDNPEDL